MRITAVLLVLLLLAGCAPVEKAFDPKPEPPGPVQPQPQDPQPKPPEPPPVKPSEPPEQTLEERLAALPTGLDRTEKSYWFRRNTEHKQPRPGISQALIDKYGVIVLGSAEQKHVYLTFDLGYELGFTAGMLDVLKEEGVPAAFFVTGLTVRTQPDLVKRIVADGHVLANHSVNHPSLPTLSLEQMKDELMELDDKIFALTGQRTHFFRPPMGTYSEHSLAVTQALGYRTVFWSMAYKDWVVDEQPGAAYALEHVTANIHPGAVILLHAVSQSNAEALPAIIRELKAQGYEFRSLEDFRAPRGN
jgi:peptidoglycan-N-acetylmuramic acid deacetylase